MNISRCISGALFGFSLLACGSADVHAPPPVAPTDKAESPPRGDENKTTAGAPTTCKKADACYKLGVRYEKGEGVPQDSSLAASLFARACDGDVAEACFDLAVLVEQGRGVAKDGPRATELYSKACEGGDGRGCLNLHMDGCDRGQALSCAALAELFEAGARVAKDLSRAMEYTAKACEAGQFASCSKAGLALIPEGATGSAEDESRAAKLFTKGCDGNDAPSCGGLALAYAQGRGVAKDEKRAITLALKACEGGIVSACFQAADMYRSGRGTPKDEKRATEIYASACRRDQHPECAVLDELLQAGADEDEKRAFALYGRSCAGGDAEACNTLGKLYATRRHIPAAQERAYNLFQHACDHDAYDACYTLARMHLNGVGAKRDVGLALEPLRKACGGGVAEACLAYGDIGVDLNRKPKNPDEDYSHLILQRTKEVYERGCELGNKEACRKAAKLK